MGSAWPLLHVAVHMQRTCLQYGGLSSATPAALYRGNKVANSAHYLVGVVSSPEIGDGTL